MITNEFVRNRIMELKPVATEGNTNKKTLELLDYLFQNLYLFANRVIAYCFDKYQHTPIEDIPYLQGMEKVRRVEQAIQHYHIQAAKCEEEAEKARLKKRAENLTEIKRYYRRNTLKKTFAAECRKDEFLQELVQRFPHIPHTVAFNTFFEVHQQFLQDWPRVKEGSRQMRQYAKGMPIYFGYDDNFTPFSITEKDGKEEVRYKWMTGRDSEKEICFKVIFGNDKSENKKILADYIIGHENSHKLLGDSFIQIDRRKNKIFLNQTFKLPQPTKEVQQKELNPALVLGVDLGVKVPIYWALSNGTDAQPIGSEHQIKKLRNQFTDRIHNLQKDLKAEGAAGRGQSARLSPLKAIRKKERDLLKQINRKMAKELIEVAVAKGAGTIHLEDVDFTEKKKLWAAGRLLLNEGLTDMKVIKEYDSLYDRMFTMFRNWSYGQLIRFIKEQAENYGIQVLFVDPRQSSKVCNVCGAQGKRPRQLYLEVSKTEKCVFGNCPAEKTVKDKRNQKKTIHLLNADRNAAFNIAKSTKYVVPADKQPTDWATCLKDEYNKQKENRGNKRNYKRGMKVSVPNKANQSAK